MIISKAPILERLVCLARTIANFLFDEMDQFDATDRRRVSAGLFQSVIIGGATRPKSHNATPRLKLLSPQGA